jgi:hypothetical protein
MLCLRGFSWRVLDISFEGVRLLCYGRGEGSRWKARSAELRTFDTERRIYVSKEAGRSGKSYL